jgi:hypothetical protein
LAYYAVGLIIKLFGYQTKVSGPCQFVYVCGHDLPQFVARSWWKLPMVVISGDQVIG